MDAPVRRVHSFMPALDEYTGIPMEVFIGVESERDQSLICMGSYYGRERVFEVLVITDRDSYRMDVMRSTLTTATSTQPIAHEAENCSLVTRDFVQAVRERRAPACTAESVLAAMRVLQQVQDRWDAQHGSRAIPGRPL